MLRSDIRSKAPQKEKTKSAQIFGVIFALLLVVSVSLALYPTVSKIINTANANSTVDGYAERVDTMTRSEIDELFHQAEQYNAELATVVRSDDMLDFDPKEHYYDILDINDDGIMGSVEIPVINVRLPIYHGTEKEFLDEGAGHLLGTSFPIGGESTHAVISAHTAFPGKQFFDKLTDLKIGDAFYVKVLNRTLEYEVTDIQVVLPSESQALSIVQGKDLVTLVTCTPYSINTHRLLVTGEMVERTDSLLSSGEDTAPPTTDSPPTNSNDFSYMYIVVGIVALFIVLAVVLAVSAVKKRKRRKNEEEESK